MNRTAERWVTAALEHSETWGMVWFGLLFWGSVLFAVAQQTFADASPWTVGWAAYATGLAAGLVAKVRGGWL